MEGRKEGRLRKEAHRARVAGHEGDGHLEDVLG
jgi:hypothetical protein